MPYLGLKLTPDAWLYRLSAPVSGVTINYLIVGGGGAGEDTNAGALGRPWSGGTGGQVLTGSFVLPSSSRLELYAGLGGAAPTFGQTGISGSNNAEITFAQAGQASTIKKGPLGNTILLASSSGGFEGGHYGSSYTGQGGFGGNGINPPTFYYDPDQDINFYIGGNGIPTTSFIDGTQVYYGAGGGGGDPDSNDSAQNGTTTAPNFGLGGITGNYYATGATPTAGLGGVVMLSGPSASFGGAGTSYTGCTMTTFGSNRILTYTGYGTYNS